MNLLRILAIFIFAGILSVSAHSQNLLPEFSVRELTQGKIQVSWNNPFETCIQLAVQRSADSVTNFRTIFSTLSPELPANGFVDNKPMYGRISYYRIFYVLQGGAYYFTKPIGMEAKMPFVDRPVLKIDPSKRTSRARITAEPDPKSLISLLIKGSEVFTLTKPEYLQFRDSINTRTKDALQRINDNTIEWRPARPTRNTEIFGIYRKNILMAQLNATEYKKFKDSIASGTRDTLYTVDIGRVQLRPFIPQTKGYISVYRNDSLVMQLDPAFYKKFRDSISTQTKDTLYSIDSRQLEIHPFMVKYAWRPSYYVFTNTRGYVTILLPLVKQYRYRIIFYDEDGSELFQIKSLKEVELVLDKTNFMHAGWFTFELFENDKLKEKNKFYLAKD